MAGDPAFKQLVEMGIPGGRARAALKKSHNDVMAAAEAVFTGKYDDIPSDDEGEDDTPVASGSGTAAGQAEARERSVSSRVGAIDVKSDSESDFEILEGSGDEVMMEEDDDEDGGFGAFDESDDEEANRTFSDPYAGIFFSKDRTETIIETVEPPVKVTVVLDEPVQVRILSNGEWMSGCPEGSEQSHLFQLLNKLSSEPVQCSGFCGHEFKRRKQDFFGLFPDFPKYINYVSSLITLTCPDCAQLTCLACGQPCKKGAADLDFINRSDKGKGKEKKADKEVEGVVSVERDSLLHCVDVQGVILGVGLFMIENASSTKRTPDSLVSDNSTPPAKRRKKAIAAGLAKDQESDDEAEMDDYAGGVGLGERQGRGKSFAAGTGYSGGHAEDRSGQIKAEKAQKAADTKMATLLSQVQVYLPSMNRESGSRTSDHMVHPTALAHLRRRSGFVGELLRNDSLLDMSNRGDLYRALFDWLEVVSSHEALASMMAMPQMRPVSSSPIPNQPKDFAVIYEGGPSPRELLEYIVIQATAAVKGLQATGTAGADDGKKKEMTEEEMRVTMDQHKKEEEEKKKARGEGENEVLMDFCQRIIACATSIDRSLVDTKGRDFVNRMKDSLPKLPPSGEDFGGSVVAESGATGEAIIKIYEEWAMKTRFQYADLTHPNTPEGKISYRHAYDSSILALEGQSAPKRSLAIAKELAILTTSLPVAWHSTVFLRVDESRVDCIKAMIIGPEGTPYQNGCFIFDIFLPLEYNQKSPLVKSMTTYGGRFRYNPNLYAEGKVCLSLLGTWQGPGWIAGQSTLLQVLISIQSLIMCEEPYLNEPGWANDGGSANSKAYSANVRRMVLIDAMAENIKNPPYPFENEIRTHFRLKAPSIREQLVKWEKMDDGRAVAGDSMSHGAPVSGKTTPFVQAATALKVLLDGLDGKKSSPSETEAGKIKPVVIEITDDDDDAGDDEDDLD